MSNTVVKNNRQLLERSDQPAAIWISAQLVSYIFHPLFIATYVTAFLVYVHPSEYAGAYPFEKLKVLVSIFFNTAFLPGFAVFLMWLLKLIPSLYLRTKKERIIPLAVTMIFYFWAWYVRINLPDTPLLIKQFLMASFLGVCAAWFFNIAFTISMHTIAIGAMAIFFLLDSLKDEYSSGLYVSIAILVAGLVTTSRLIVSHHTPKEIYSGLIAGAACALMAWKWYQ